jgi:hypothetical protein
MSEDDSLLRDLESLRERSESSRLVDVAVDYTANSKAREAILEELSLLHNQTAAKYSQATQFGAFSNVVIRSHKGILRPYNLVLDIEISDARLMLSIDLQGSSGWGTIDNLYDRSLFFNEYEQRYQALYTALAKGLLDNYLKYPPELLIHSIMGFSGELLPVLGIDPNKGETYTALKLAERPRATVQAQWAAPIVGFLEAVFKVKGGEPKSATAEAKTPKADIIGITNQKLGLTVSVLTEEQREAMGLPAEVMGVVVTEVVEDSPAHKAGVRGCDRKVARGIVEVPVGGDIVLGVDGKATRTIQEFIQWLWSKPAVSSLRVYRNGSVIDLTLNA